MLELILCKQKNVLKTKAGKTYYSLILQDKTGTVDARSGNSIMGLRTLRPWILYIVKEW